MLARVASFHTRAALVTETDRALQDAGKRGFEAFVLWTGEIEGSRFITREVHVPKQTSYQLKDGACVRVDGAELHRLNVWLFQNRRVLGAQVHSHPGTAYHSDTDDGFPIASERGALSLVIPHFGRAGLCGPGVAGYRLRDDGWIEISQRQFSEVLIVDG